MLLPVPVDTLMFVDTPCDVLGAVVVMLVTSATVDVLGRWLLVETTVDCVDACDDVNSCVVVAFAVVVDGCEVEETCVVVFFFEVLVSGAGVAVVV